MAKGILFMSQRIVHNGIVEQLADGCMKIRIVQASACAACKVAGQCHASDKKEKIVDVFHAGNGTSFQVGEEVRVVASAQMGVNAVVLAFCIPFLIMVIGVLTVNRITSDEPLAALSGIACLIPYYIILYLCRHRIQGRFAFHVEKIK